MQKINFQDLPSTDTPINSSNLNTLQNNVESAIPTNSNIVDLIYPVGAIYMSVNSTSPATLFGGTWERIQDKFLLSAGTTYSAGSTGGSANVSYTPAGTVGGHTLTTSEIPKHTHTYSKSATATGSHTLTVNEMPSHNHVQNSGSKNAVAGSGSYHNNTTVAGEYSTSVGAATTYQQITLSTGGGQGHTHSITLTSTNSGETGTGGSHNHGFTGTQASISTMSPYLAVYVWKRTA